MHVSDFVAFLNSNPEWFEIECGTNGDDYGPSWSGKSYLKVKFDLVKEGFYKMIILDNKEYDKLVPKGHMTSTEALDWIAEKVMREPYWGVSMPLSEEDFEES